MFPVQFGNGWLVGVLFTGEECFSHPQQIPWLPAALCVGLGSSGILPVHLRMLFIVIFGHILLNIFIATSVPLPLHLIKKKSF